MESVDCVAVLHLLLGLSLTVCMMLIEAGVLAMEESVRKSVNSTGVTMLTMLTMMVTPSVTMWQGVKVCFSECSH